VNFIKTEINGVYLIEPDLLSDDRGFFARTWCEDEFQAAGLNAHLVQCNISFNKKRGTIRGMHYQTEPYSETKVIRCTMGAIYDVALDLRPTSPTRHRWIAVRLNAGNHRMIYIPEGVSHGFQTLQDNTEVFYQMSEKYRPECSRGVRWDDPAFGIRWPFEVSSISKKDSSYPYVEGQE
jgi:dTDP-4-dehydrorhamnose 3,5-epimerase